jgi:hypothetical protein
MAKQTKVEIFFWRRFAFSRSFRRHAGWKVMQA